MIRKVLICSAAVLTLVATGSAHARAKSVHTAAAPVHACLPLADDSLLAATDGGLVRVSGDARPLSVWTALDGLAGTRTYSILREGDTLWIGSEYGLVRARLQGNRLDVAATYAAKPVRAITRLGTALYVGTWGGGVLRLRGTRLVPVRFAGNGPRNRLRISDLAVRGNDLIAATAGSGVYRLQNNRLRPMDIGLQRALVWSVEVVDAGAEKDLWIATVDGLYRVEDGRARRVHQGDVRHLARTETGLVAATFDSGVRRVRGVSVSALPGAPRGAHAYTYAEAGGAACIGTHEDLWTRGAQSRSWRKAELAGPPSGDIAALAVDGDRLWVGTFDRGLAVFENGRWRHVEDRRIDSKINALAVADNKLWVATSAGLNTVAGDRVTHIDKRDGMPSRHVLSLAALKNGGIVAGTTRGAVVIRNGQLTVLGRKRGLYISNVWAVAEGSDGWLWLGTTKGLYRVAAAGDTWQRFSVASGHLRDDWVMAVKVARDSIWIGTYKGGVTRMYADDTAGAESGFNAVHISDGWVNPGGLAWHGDTLYAATMEGLLQGDGTGMTARENASPGRDTTAVAAQGKRLWVASRRGLAVFETP